MTHHQGCSRQNLRQILAWVLLRAVAAVLSGLGVLGITSDGNFRELL
jgi:hypothetical protein